MRRLLLLLISANWEDLEKERESADEDYETTEKKCDLHSRVKKRRRHGQASPPTQRSQRPVIATLLTSCLHLLVAAAALLL